jgi:iron complex transport system substrate-binding protein
VGVTRWCKEVLPAAKANVFNHLTLFDDCWNADPAAVAALKPDLVIGSVPYRAKVVEGLIGLGLRFLATYPRCLADIYREIRLLGRIVDAAPAADRLVEWMQSEIESVRLRAAQAQGRPRIYCEEWSNPLQNSQLWVAELVEAAGGEFVPQPPARKVTAEEVIAANPEVIAVAWCGTNDRSRPDVVRRRPGWDAIEAVHRNRIHAVRDELLNTPGPNLIEGLRELAALIHPELFTSGQQLKATGL